MTDLIRSNNHTEQEIHKVFDVSLLFKGLIAAAEMLGGIILAAVGPGAILNFVNTFVGGEIREDPHDVVANYLLHLAQTFGGSSKSFAALYLLVHGIVNGAIVVALWKEKLWAYPISFVVLVAFVLYQLYYLTFGFSWWVLAVTIIDIFILVLVWHEYGVLKKRHASS